MAIMPYAALALISITAFAHGASGATSGSGRYGSLLLVVSGDTVSGAYTDQRMGNGTPDAPQFSCSFLVRGTLRDGAATIQTWYPGDTQAIPGHLTLSPTTAAFVLAENPPGCAMTSGDMTHDLVENARNSGGERWIGVRLVTASRARFHSNPGPGRPNGRYIVRGSAVIVFARRRGWLDAGYPFADKPVRGWLAAADLAPEAVPGQGNPSVEGRGGGR